ncbi:MAG TPA: hypothetical protein VEC12_09915, partial [Bacteroidia bacterium]|nr:hypothetical protein [Bacteroidia bacterium]
TPTDSLHQGNDNPPHGELPGPLPTDPFRGNVEPSNHPSDSGVKEPGIVGNLVTPTFENIPSPPINDAVEALNVAPLHVERGNVELLNRSSDSGVREQFEPLDTLVTSTFKKEITPTDSLHQGNDNPPHGELPGPLPPTPSGAKLSHRTILLIQG